MIGFTPLFRSPIRSTPPKSNPRFNLSDLSGVPVILIQGAVDELLQKNFGNVPSRPNQMVRVGDGLLAHPALRDDANANHRRDWFRSRTFS